jgi:hypothetical protein
MPMLQAYPHQAASCFRNSALVALSTPTLNHAAVCRILVCMQGDARAQQCVLPRSRAASTGERMQLLLHELWPA